jgi:hypothetical protein
MTTLSERNEIAAFVLEEVARATAVADALHHLPSVLHERAQSLRQSPVPTAEGKVELYRLTGTTCLGRTQPHAPVYERDTAAEAVIEAARIVVSQIDDSDAGRINPRPHDWRQKLVSALSAYDRGVNNG